MTPVPTPALDEEESPMPAAEPMTQEIVGRLKELLPRILPITIRDGPDYADLLFGEHATQAMTMDPATWLEIGRLLETLLSTLTNLTPSGVERAANQMFDESQTMVCEEEEGIIRRFWNELGEQERKDWRRLASAALALPSEPPSQGDVEGRAREEAAFEKRWEEIVNGGLGQGDKHIFRAGWKALATKRAKQNWSRGFAEGARSQSERVSRLEEAVEEAVIALVECAAILRGKGFPALAGIIDNYIERARSALNQGADDGR